MRTNIDIDDQVLEAAMKAGPFKTKKEAVDAGLKLLARQQVYRDLLALQGKLHWDGDSDTVPAATGARTAAKHAGRSLRARPEPKAKAKP